MTLNKKGFCSKGHPLTEGNLRGGKKLASGRLECLTCHRERELKRGRENGAKPRNKNPPKCPKGHDLTFDNLRKGVRLQNGKKECLTCHRESAQRRYNSNPEKHSKDSSNWQKANRPKRNEYMTSYRLNNLEKLRSYFRNQGRFRRLGKNQDSFNYSQILRDDPCSYCGGIAGTIDHIIPVSKGGGNNWDNLTAACGKCNSEKKNRNLLEFLIIKRNEKVFFK